MPGPRLLVVDDDEGLLILMGECLRAEGYEVETAASGAAATAALKQRRPDLMLLDLNLRDVGGTALVEQVRVIAAGVPFVVVTGQGDQKIAIEVMKQGALDYVMKDTAMLDLLPEVVRRAFAVIGQERALLEAQARLRESVSRFATAVRATNDGVWEWQIPDERIYFSDRWKEILGYAPDELQDNRSEWIERVHPEDRDRLVKAKQVCLESGSSFKLEYRMRHRDGGYRWILCRALLDRDADGRPLRLTGAHTDITENKRLEQEILAISEREQRRIGQDLHDGLGQQLTAIELMLHTIRSDLEGDRPDVAGQLGQMSRFLRDAITQTRSLAHGLTAFMLDATGLQSALADLAERTSAVGRISCVFECPDQVTLEESSAAGHLYRIAQEAVGNALRHAQATKITIRLEQTASSVVLSVIDDGRGFARSPSSGGIGLRVMEHRANAIGADLTVDRGPDAGVVVTCTLNRRA